MAERGVSTVHNPMSNFKLSSGLSPVKRLLAAGINVALGSDGPATGDSADFMQSIRFAALVHKLDLARAADALFAKQQALERAAGVERERDGLRGKVKDLLSFGRHHEGGGCWHTREVGGCWYGEGTSFR